MDSVVPKTTIDIPLCANRDERKLHIDDYFDGSTRLFIIVCARCLVRMNLLPLLHPFGHLHVMYARALPLGARARVGAVVGLSRMPGSACQALGEQSVIVNFATRSMSAEGPHAFVRLCPSPV